MNDAATTTALPTFTETRFTRRKHRSEIIAKCVFGAMALAIVIPLLLILGYLIYKAAPLLSWDFLTTNPTNGMRRGGIWSALLGTIYLVTFSLLIAAPIGVFAAVYLNEYAKENWFTRIINLAVVNLAGVPSIVHALFGLGAFVLFAGMGRSIIAASLTLAIMTLPVTIASTKEALASVPMSFREACWKVGATRWQTIRRIVLPNSISGILTGASSRSHAPLAKQLPSCSLAPFSTETSPKEICWLTRLRIMHGSFHAPLHSDHPSHQCAGCTSLCHSSGASRLGPARQCDGHHLPNLSSFS